MQPLFFFSWLQIIGEVGSGEDFLCCRITQQRKNVVGGIADNGQLVLRFCEQNKELSLLLCFCLKCSWRTLKLEGRMTWAALPISNWSSKVVDFFFMGLLNIPNYEIVIFRAIDSQFYAAKMREPFRLFDCWKLARSGNILLSACSYCSIEHFTFYFILSITVRTMYQT